MMAPNLQGGAQPGFGAPKPETVLKGTVESGAAREQQYDCPDFNGKDDDPRARGAESSMDIIMGTSN